MVTTAVEVGVRLLAQVHTLVLCERRGQLSFLLSPVQGPRGPRKLPEAAEARTCHHLEGSHADIILSHFLEQLIWQERGWSVRASSWPPRL